MEKMQKKFRDSIKEHFPTLVDRVDPEALTKYLMKKKILNKKDVKKILAFQDSDIKHSNRLLIFQILKKNDAAYHEFLKGLEIFKLNDLLLPNTQRTHITAFNPVNQNRLDEELVNFSNLSLHSSVDRNDNTAISNTLASGEARLLEVKVKLATKFQDMDEDNVYETKSIKRGQALIINNRDFKKHDAREGSEHDMKCAESLFKQMFFEVRTYTDLSVVEMEQVIQEFSRYDPDKSSDICVVIIMSHGIERNKELVILDKADDGLKTSWIEEQFNNSKCPLFTGKPKILFYQMCRGSQLDYAITSSTRIDRTPNLVNSDHSNNDSVQTDSGHMLPVVERRLEDMLIGYSTQKGYKSHRDPSLGSWYIQLICQVFMERAHNTDIVDMLNMVDRKLKKRASAEYSMQTSVYVSNGFNKRMYFNPGIYSDTDGNIRRFSSLG